MRWEILGTFILAVGASIAWADELPRDTNSIQTLTAEQAEELVGRDSSGSVLELDGLQSLTAEVASVLANWFGTLSIDGLTSISLEAAESLSKHRGPLSLDGITTLSLDAAEVLAEHDGSVSVDGLVLQDHVPVEVAAIAANLGGRPDTCGNGGMMFRSRGYAPNTKDLKEISRELARALALRYPDRDLDLNGLTTITPEVARALARYRGRLLLNGLQSMPLDAEVALANHRYDRGTGGIECRGLTMLASKELAEILRWVGDFNYSNKLASISPEAARVLVGKDMPYPPQSLSLNYLTELTPEVAAALTEFKGSLSMNGLTSLSAEAARELMRLRQIPEQYSYPSLSLNGLTTISREVAIELAKNPDFLSLDGLTEISPELARALAKHKGYLCLNGLTSLSDEAAEALARHEGGLSLGVTALSDAAAKSLAINTGPLRLRRIANASPKALALLKARGLRLWMPLQMYSPLERFTWGLTGWLQVALLASLTVMIGCIACSFYLLRRLSKATEWTLATKRQVKESAVPLVIGSGLFTGWCLFLSMKLLPVWRFVFAESGTSWPSESFTPLDRLFAVIFLLNISACCYCACIVHRMRKRGLTQFVMTRFLPSSLSPGKRMVLVFIVVVWIAYAGAIVLFGVSLTLNTFLRQFWPSGGSYELFVFGLAYVGFGVVPIMFGALMLYPLWVRWSRGDRSFDAYSDHFTVAMSQMHPSSNSKKGFGFGEGCFPWSAVESYSWQPDHLELTVRPGRPHNKDAEQWRVCGVVPKDQQRVAHEFLVARMPGDGQPSGS